MLKLQEGTDYVIVKDLGQGACGKVFSAFLKDTGEPVVVKRGSLKDLREECNILNGLRGKPNIIQVLGSDEGPHEMSIIMEKAQCSLDRLLRMVPFMNGLPPFSIQRLCSDIGTALQLLIEEKITHRDVKPQNILVFGDCMQTKSYAFHFKLCDFGFARELENQEQGLYSIVGTEAYLHPALMGEYVKHPGQRRMNTPYQAERCDLWSIGVTLFNAATATLPFPAARHILNDMLSQRPNGAITARVEKNGGFKYYYSIRNDFYPIWLRQCINSMIVQQLDCPEYGKFLSACRCLSSARPRQILVLPRFAMSNHMELPATQFPDRLALNEVLGVPRDAEPVIVSRRFVHFVSPGTTIRVAELPPNEVVVVWCKQATGTASTLPLGPPMVEPRTSDEKWTALLQRAFMAHEEAEDLCSHWDSLGQILRSQLERVSVKCSELLAATKTASAELRVAETLGAVACAVSKEGKDVAEPLGDARRELCKHSAALSSYQAELAVHEGQLAPLFTPMPDRAVPNCRDALERLRRGSGSEVDKKWTETIMKRCEERVAGLKKDISERLSDSATSPLFESFFSLSRQLHLTHEKLRDTIALVLSTLHASQNRVSKFLATYSGNAGEDLRQKLTKTASFRREMKLQMHQIEELCKKIDAVSVNVIDKSALLL